MNQYQKSTNINLLNKTKQNKTKLCKTTYIKNIARKINTFNPKNKFTLCKIYKNYR